MAERRADVYLSSKYRNINDHIRGQTPLSLVDTVIEVHICKQHYTPMETANSGNRYAGIRKTLGADLFQKVQNSRVLVVGAGGMGVIVEKPSYGRFCRHRSY